MKLTVERSAILASLSFVALYVEQRANIPILNDVLLEASGDGVTVTGTDMDRVARDRFPANIEAEGRICLPGHLLLKALKNGAGSEVSIDADDAWATVRIGKSRLKLPVLPADDFPMLEIMTRDAAHNFTMGGEALSAIGDKVSFARETGPSARHFLSGTGWRARDDKIEFAAGASSRMAVQSMPIDTGDFDANVPTFPIPSWDGDVSIAVSETFIRLQSGDQVLASKLIDTPFADYHSMQPIPDNEARLTFDRVELLAAANRCGMISGSIMLVGRDGATVLSSTSPAAGEISDEVSYEGCDFQTAIVHQTLAGVLDSFDCKTIEMRWRSHDAGVTVHDPADDTRLVVMQPYRDFRLSEFITAKEAAE